ncbi:MULTISPECIES: hypothetical protein [Streptomyces]|uniref:Integral membrane protein n=1 Tax=Streptomyces dengpaensis TaxID=2049881 RepID=A0ABM6SR28_9ACTN|nr:MULTISPECIES: hypothetical protein [Streptomyces]AVH57012.1 hypothetical protein C4B68_15880 [Streptomyces dengpaensis]PIB09086.1 hypothetical protein B1C81_12640 [Streptomyces sp. HG99]
MSQSTPPPSGNPYADQPGQPQQGVPQPGFPTAPVAPAAPVRDSLGLGLAAAFGAAVVTAGVYGAIIGLTKHEIGWAAVGVGFLIGLAAGRVGGRNPILPIVSVVLSAASVYFGQLIGEAMIGAKELGVGFSEVFFDNFGLVQEAWKADSDPLTFVFFAIAAYVAFTSARKAGQ